MLIQCVGLLRMSHYPINYSTFPVLTGFSAMELWFIPNIFFGLFPVAYE